MIVAGPIFVAVATLTHIYILYPESITWEGKQARAVSGTDSAERAQTTKLMASNRGSYNLFLALLTIVGIATQAAGSSAVRLTLAFAGTTSMLAVAAVLFIASAPRRAVVPKQDAFPLLVIRSLGLGLML